MNILITGGTGLLGGAILEEISNKHNITAIVRQIPEIVQEGVTYIASDLSKPIDFTSFPGQIDAVIHLAQSLNYRDFPRSAMDVFQVNTASTAALLDYAVKAGAKYFFYASTGSVYEPYQRTLQENEVLEPTSYYAASKLAAERILFAYEKYMNVCAFRLFFLYGPSQNNGLLASLISKVHSRQPILLDGENDGLHFTPTHVADVAKLIRMAVENEWGGILNVASPEISNIRKAAVEISKLLEVSPLFERTGKTDPPSIIPCLKKLELFCPKFVFRSLKEGIADLSFKKKPISIKI